MPVTTHTPALALTILMALIYLVAVRLVDMNEKEPLWAVGMLFAFGVLAAVGLTLGVDASVLELTVVPSALCKELARFLAIALGVAVLTAIGQSRGWSEINGLMDGVVYGAAGGLGFATGQEFIRELASGGAAVAVPGLGAHSAAGFGSVALVGLADGVFGALMGIGFAYAIFAPSAWQRALGPIAGYAAAVSAHVSYDALGHANALGDEGLMRSWVALLLPASIVVVVAAVALARERSAIRGELAAEVDGGVVSQRDLELLQSLAAREVEYLKKLVRGDFVGWSRLKGLHNRQVQLALAKRRGSEQEAASLRQAVLVARAMLDAAPTAPPPASREKPDEDEGEKEPAPVAGAESTEGPSAAAKEAGEEPGKEEDADEAGSKDAGDDGDEGGKA
ncbi:MAG: PrsW family intramembrane metalloprotease [Deltaproteobacteria bacterium]|nr:PrsW family intramembrane metalloprotease [Deltaproteobacteria bacterium]